MHRLLLVVVMAFVGLASFLDRPAHSLYLQCVHQHTAQAIAREVSQLSVSGGFDADRSVQERIVGLAYRLRERIE